MYRPSSAPRRGDLLLINPRYARNRCSSAGRHALTPSLALPSIAAADCQGVFIGFETLSAQNLRHQRKRTLGPADYGRAVRLLHDHGVEVNGSFVFGFDGDGPEVYDRTLEFIRRQRQLCSWDCVLARRPRAPTAASAAARTAAYLAMTLQYKQCDWVWRGMVPLRLNHAAWQPLIQLHSWLASRQARAACASVSRELRVES